MVPKGEGTDFTTFSLGGGVNLHLQQTDLFNVTRVDIFLRQILRQGANTRGALIGRLLERGTRQLPDMTHLSRFIDDLYGASFAAGVEQCGSWQVLHLGLELVDDTLLPPGEGVLERGMAFLSQVLQQPAGREDCFSADYLEQEKQALAQFIDSLQNDKTALARRLCIEAMCADEPFGLSPYGCVADFDQIDPENLFAEFADLLATAPMDIFVSGRLGFDRAQSLCQTYFSWSRRPTPKPLLDPPVAAGPRVLNVAEPRLGQGRLVMGCRTDLGPNHTDQPALILFNALLGGDSHSRLFRHLREGAGLCYYIHSYLESLSQLLLVEAGIEEGDYQQVQREIGAQIEAIGSGRFADEEMDQVKHVLLRRLETMGDNREGLMRFYFRQQLDGTNWDRQELWRRLVAVGRTELARAAKGIHLDTVFFLHSPNFEPQA